MYKTDRIKQALTAISGNKPFTLQDFDQYYNGNGPVGELTRDQISKAIRAQKHVKRVARGVYSVKGRRTA